MSLNGIKISDMTPITLDDARAGDSQVPIVIDGGVGSNKVNKRISLNTLNTHNNMSDIQGGPLMIIII